MALPLFFEEDLPDNIRSKYEAVIVAGLRARELQRGVKPLIDEAAGHKHTTIAMMELLADKLQFERIEPVEKPEVPEQDSLQ